MRQSYTGAAREGSERPSGRRAALALPAMRKLALLAALWMRGARVFVRQSSETPGALESCMRRSSGGLRDGVAHAIVPMHRSDGGVWRVLPLGAHVLLVCCSESDATLLTAHGTRITVASLCASNF